MVSLYREVRIQRDFLQWGHAYKVRLVLEWGREPCVGGAEPLPEVGHTYKVQ